MLLLLLLLLFLLMFFAGAGRPTPKGHHKNVNNIPKQQQQSSITTSIRDKRAENQGPMILTRKGKKGDHRQRRLQSKQQQNKTVKKTLEWEIKLYKGGIRNTDTFYAK